MEPVDAPLAALMPKGKASDVQSDGSSGVVLLVHVDPGVMTNHCTSTPLGAWTFLSTTVAKLTTCLPTEATLGRSTRIWCFRIN